ncbi:glycoside hydrolase [Coemansia reversa NRRL 1564]|uniref:mannan endo-1,4-beta-mannosidase n=1 Tax=Coemansia reversa (strain ATCC 12441 / NRRL 1564) TaxID=763665 RepID=A0A2G5B7V8_COERN|nr:glycoside hydrolase [Coemansia reversa NRRL 1564]|eukprot:PIA15080.1 glycoside hydrolase [Coemansia reversa NRRL 1564]
MLEPNRSQFVSASGTRLFRDGQPYFVSGANYWQAMNLGMAAGSSGDRKRVLCDLASLSKRGVNMIRILAATEGSQFGTQPDRMYPVLMTAPGQYEEDVFAGLDWFLAQLPKFNMTATVSLTNYWTWSGGIAQYVSWITDTRIPYPKQWDHLQQIFVGGDYEVFLNYTNRFYADASIYETVQQLFKTHIKAVVNRRNTVNGINYRDDPAIMAWELMNEPQIIAGNNGQQQLFQWIDDTAGFIHSLDPHHLITTGAESKNGEQWFKAMHQSRHITLASCHFWPLNWGYYNSTDPTNASIDYSISKMQVFVEDNARWARDMGIPVVLFEFGMMRDNWGKFSGLGGYDPQAPVTHRNMFYTAVVNRIAELANDGMFAGAAFWAYAGIARPPTKPTTDITWTGDPPHEPPGWNSVYNDDEKTLNIISMFSQLLLS